MSAHITSEILIIVKADDPLASHLGATLKKCFFVEHKKRRNFHQVGKLISKWQTLRNAFEQ